MPRLSKKFAVLLVLAMLASMFVGMGTVSASSTYSAINVPAVTAGATYYTGAAGQLFNRIGVTVAAGSLTGVAAPYGTVRISLPTDTYVNIGAPVLPATLPGSAVNNGIDGVTVAGVAGTRGTDVNGDAVYREYDITITSTNASAINGGYIPLDLFRFVVPGGASGSINASFDAAPNSCFSSGTVTIATVGTGVVSVSIDKVKTISSAGGAIEPLKIKEDRPGAIVASTKTLKYKLPTGFTWANPAAIDPAMVYGNLNPGAGTLSLTDNDRTLVLNTNALGASTAATYLTISGLSIVVDDTIAKIGDVVCSISGDSTCGQSEITVAKYGDYSVTASAFGDPKDVKAGRIDQEVGQFQIVEGMQGSLVNGRTITATLTGGAKWRTMPVNDATNTKNLPGAQTWAVNGTIGDTIKCTWVGTTTDAMTWVLKKATVDVSAAAEGDIKVVFGGTAGVTGEFVIAKAVKPATITIDGNPVEIIAGTQGALLTDIIVTETMKEGIDATAGNTLRTGYIYVGGVYYADNDLSGGLNAGDTIVPSTEALTTTANNELRVEFPMDIKPGLPSKVEVVEGDVVLDMNSIALDVTADGRWYIKVTVKSTSSTPAKIKFTGVKLSTQRNYTEGDIRAALKGPAVVQTTAQFPGYTSISSCVVGKVVTPADTAGKADGVFVIGQTTFKLFGVEQTMEAAPYIKDGRTFLPLAYVAESLGVTASNIIWDPANQTVTLMKGDKVVQVKIGSKTLLVNGAAITMDAAPEIVNGRTCLPIALIAQAFGASATWDAATQTVTIK